MTTYEIAPSKVSGKAKIPTSKSHSLRAILFGLLANGKTKISHYLNSPDIFAMIHAIQCYGAKVEINKSAIEIEGVDGKLLPCEDVIDSGNSGIVYRFIAAIAALSDQYTIITGDHSIRHQRPIEPLLSALEQLGCFAKSSRGDGDGPVIIRGPIENTKASFEAQDSQFVSSLLFACAFSKNPVELKAINPGEIPWVKLSLCWLDRLNIPYENQKFQSYKVFGGAKIQGFEYTVPGDL